jgi:hypothetical protein
LKGLLVRRQDSKFYPVSLGASLNHSWKFDKQFQPRAKKAQEALFNAKKQTISLFSLREKSRGRPFIGEKGKNSTFYLFRAK